MTYFSNFLAFGADRLSDNNRCIGIDTNYVHWLSGGNLRVERDNIGTACRVALSKTTTAENKPRRVCTQKVPVQRSRSRKRPMEQTGCIPVNNGNDCLWVLRQRGGDHERSGTCSGAHGARGPERTNERGRRTGVPRWQQRRWWSPALGWCRCC
mmetsp:Transcript_6674/g.15974  ORF Transcript_6674/g.15974 Transcript_6674/m.15974 type:complete len:154 (-) Transcript_6674:1759-2220(-)